MTEQLDRLNEQLDELLIKQLQLIQDYINITVECESQQKTGFINLAKARYIQGFHSVSRNCLFSEDSEEERHALLTVTRKGSAIEFEAKEFQDPAVTYQKPILNVNTDTSIESQLSKQFGFLSSSTLKYAKADFRKCIEKTIERAQIVEQSFVLRKLYKKLMKEKLSIQNSVPSP